MRRHFERQFHTTHARIPVDEHRNLVTLGVFEQQCRTARLHRAVGKLGNLEHRIHFHLDPFQLPFFLQSSNEGAQIAVGHG
jgi:hypothetical protein